MVRSASDTIIRTIPCHLLASAKTAKALFNSATSPALSHTKPALHCGIFGRPILGMLKRPVKTACCVACICQNDVSRAVSTLTTSNKLAAVAVRGGLSACSDGCCRWCRQYIHATAVCRGPEDHSHSMTYTRRRDAMSSETR